MPMTDAAITLSSNQAVTVSAVSTNTYDSGPGVRDFGAGEEINVLVRVAATATAAGAATVQFQIIESTAANLSSPTVIGQSDAISIANLAVGAQIAIPVPRQFVFPFGKRYIGMNYVVGTGPLTGGAFDAFVIIDNSSITAAGVVYPLNAPSSTGVPTGYSIK